MRSPYWSPASSTKKARDWLEIRALASQRRDLACGVIPRWSQRVGALRRPMTGSGPDLRCAIAHGGISRFRARAEPVIGRAFARPVGAPRNDARFWTLVRRRHYIHLPADRRTGMAVEEALGGDGETLGMVGIHRHPGVADRQPWIRRIADADKPETPRLLQRGQPGRPDLAGCERRRMIRTVERHRLADLRGAGRHRPSRVEPGLPGLGQFAGPVGARAIACCATVG